MSEPSLLTGWLATRMQNAKKAQRDNGQCLPDYATSPNHAYLKKHWGPWLSILCLLGDQWGRANWTSSVKALIIDQILAVTRAILFI